MDAAPRTAIALALASAGLFGISTPAAKLLVGVVDPWLLAGLLYGGSGVLLGAILAVERGRRRAREAPLGRRDWRWLGAAIGAGGVIAPVLMMLGLAWGTAAEAALLLNLEGVFTALLAWLVVREHVDRRIAAGMVAITAGALVLAWTDAGFRPSWSGALIAAACLAWAVDNNLTRKISAGDPLQIAALKGVIAGAVNVVIALAYGASLPGPSTVVAATAVGGLCYGVSLVLYIVALRHLGAGRTAAYFATAPFVGAVGAIGVLGEPVTVKLVVAALLMGIGVWLHLTERHRHEHVHEPMAHEHRHDHDVHHRHDHPPGTPAGEPHTHWHEHAPLRHQHPHYPDIHHRHSH